MSDYDKLQYAKARQSLARAMSDTPEAMKWAKHIRYWKSRVEEKSERRTQNDNVHDRTNVHYTAPSILFPTEEDAEAFCPRA